MDWSTFIPSMLGAAVPVCAFAFWLGGLAQSVKSLRETLNQAIAEIRRTCDKRGSDHCHHYEQIHSHAIELENHSTRLVSLEQWRSRAETQ